MPFQNDKDFIDSLCQKFLTLAQRTFDNEALKFSDIEQWNLESSFFESPYFLAFIFFDFRAKQKNRDVITSSKTGVLPDWLINAKTLSMLSLIN